MPCYSPLKAFRCQDGSVVFREPRNCVGQLTLPCSQCVGCRLERSRQWAVRCSHEAQLYKKNCFITLTYADEHLPAYNSLIKSDFQKFMKRLRKRFSGVDPVLKEDGSTCYPIRYYMCGEYGENFGRPHYHACIFNFDFPDKYYFRLSPAGEKLYRSSSLEELWPYGHSSIGAVTFQSAAYVARYIMKKVTGNAAASHYNPFDAETGEVYARLPEYTDMSRRPGIGAGFFDKFSTDIYPLDSVIIRGKKVKPPRYYDLKFATIDPLGFDAVKFERFEKAQLCLDDNTTDRLHVKQRLKEIQLKRLYRTLI